MFKLILCTLFVVLLFLQLSSIAYEHDLLQFSKNPKYRIYKVFEHTKSKSGPD